MSQPAVVFGGPSPEHDVSVLTGLQAARALIRGGHQVEAIYWTKTAEFYAVDPGLEAEDFLGGVPKAARELRLLACPGGGFVGAKGGLRGKERTLELSAVVNCCHGGPGEDGTLQAALDLAGLAYTGPTAAGAALGMDKLAFGGAVAEAGLPALPRWLLDGQRPGPAPEIPGPYIVKPRFGGSSIGIEVVEDWDTAVSYARTSVHQRRGAVVEPYRRVVLRSERRRAQLARSPALGDRAAPAIAGIERDPGLPGQVSRGRGNAERPPATSR